MPIFRFYCSECDEERDYFLKRGEPAVCSCGNSDLSKVYHKQTFGISGGNEHYDIKTARATILNFSNGELTVGKGRVFLVNKIEDKDTN